ncbi:E3 ubiquitin-protein ligase TRIM9-like Protein [Elysia marginata]|uniref:E3 ubiquitin-protein ligase TRIM9-like Protein n=1 Tax=Elysia marginata TaxID=1093978 RepID=A0AAV4FDW5_9GAST|nr:E3 ubiquitin-protein ligase TRIM9-like Protein [Elysia marginata]
MADSVSGNCAEFEKTVVSQCDALIEVIKQRKAELLENVAEEKDMKVHTLKEQVSDCTALLQRTTGLLQFCIEVLKESDAPSFLQIIHDHSLNVCQYFEKQYEKTPTEKHDISQFSDPRRFQEIYVNKRK